jgi:hypothetical protein
MFLQTNKTGGIIFRTTNKLKVSFGIAHSKNFLRQAETKFCLLLITYTILVAKCYMLSRDNAHPCFCAIKLTANNTTLAIISSLLLLAVRKTDNSEM